MILSLHLFCYGYFFIDFDDIVLSLHSICNLFFIDFDDIVIASIGY
ncbi:hypothetical protein mru_2150 [Methanobrevibacter ruminantium M1]|uniref:Uncharacterized protein n=1 Tax=Methanobrevibacter ruminantium (strain ATCC 35063 / DSM 1093 / JCM 13430 / OCM 146 / M1) TaxID=634498 RepID=D3E1B5_METRM|nr:hypothetical protein mru_2150 [Methanobrevibacter ruminantium M1]